jgi:hypothetical protein
MEDVVLGIVTAVAGVVVIVRRKPLAAGIVQEQNRFWRTSYGATQIAFNERVLVLLGVFSLAMAVSFWLELFWPPLIALGAGVLWLNLVRLRERRNRG